MLLEILPVKLMRAELMLHKCHTTVSIIVAELPVGSALNTIS